MKHTTRAMLRAFDAQRVEISVAMPRPRAVAQSAKRELPIWAALQWAFGTERASVDFDDLPVYQVGIDTIWRMMRQNELGCRVDGGGRSTSHSDAEVIASFVAALPIEYGGKRMALQIAELARAGIMPDPMAGAKMRCVPVGWRNTRHGVFARTEVVGRDQITFRGRKLGYDVLCCPVTYTPTPQQIGAARRNWLGWWGALLHLGYQLRTVGGLDTVSITENMPPLTPWNRTLDVEDVKL